MGAQSAILIVCEKLTIYLAAFWNYFDNFAILHKSIKQPFSTHIQKLSSDVRDTPLKYLSKMPVD